MQAAGLAGLGRIDADALLGAQECWTGGGESVNPIAQCGALARVADGEGNCTVQSAAELTTLAVP